MVNNFKLRYILFAVHTGEVSMQNVKDFFQETTKLVWSLEQKKKNENFTRQRNNFSNNKRNKYVVTQVIFN